MGLSEAVLAPMTIFQNLSRAGKVCCVSSPWLDGTFDSGSERELTLRRMPLSDAEHATGNDSKMYRQRVPFDGRPARTDARGT